jgi:hypothetical protein
VAHFRTAIPFNGAPDQAFDLVVDFSRITEWDPGAARARRIDDGPLGIGSRFEVVTKSGPVRILLTYEVLEYDRPNRARLRAVTDSFVSDDVVTLERGRNGDAILTYDADLALTGYRRLFDIPLQLAFLVIGRRAETGLRRELKKLR